MAASKQASTNVRMYVNTLPQCSPASVGLAQARPNYTLLMLLPNLEAFNFFDIIYYMKETVYCPAVNGWA